MVSRVNKLQTAKVILTLPALIPDEEKKLT